MDQCNLRDSHQTARTKHLSPGRCCLSCDPVAKPSHLSLTRRQTATNRSHCGDRHHRSINGDERWHCIIPKSRLTLPLSRYQHTLQSWRSRDLAPSPPTPVRLTPVPLSPGLPRVRYEQGFCQQSRYLHTSHPSNVPPRSSPGRLPRRSKASGHSIDVGNTFILENACGLTYLLTNATHSCSRERHPGVAGEHSNKKSPRPPVSRHSSCVCAGPAEKESGG